MATRAEAAKKLALRHTLGRLVADALRECHADPARAEVYGFAYLHNMDAFEIRFALAGTLVRELVAKNTGQQRAGPTASPHPLGSKAEEVRSRPPEADAQHHRRDA